ncbi:MAG: mannose-6-phosphate isomerase, class I, partial [Actinomycetota bacterium]|nr:mannose-6-phosphate isomerase, class I [Actinomycetota bacterium]
DGGGGHPCWRLHAEVAAVLAEHCPDDAAAAVALLLQPVRLAPGEALLVRPGQPHTYLSGTAFEVQANSDNVLRLGLTDKHVDVTAALAALDCTAGQPPTVAGCRTGVERVLAAPVSSFALAVIESAAGADLPVVPGPQIFCCTDGAFTLDDGTGMLELRRGEAAFAAARHPRVRVSGHGQLLRVTTGRSDVSKGHR